MKNLFFLVICICVNTIIYGQNNTASGTQALFSLTSGQRNTAFGYWSMYSGTNMSFNSAFGSWSMYYNQGDFNTAMGGSSLFYNNGGYENSAAGYRSLFNNTSGFRNLAIGVDALYSNNAYSPTQATLNSAAGYMSLYNNTSGNFNVAVGAYSGLNSYTGSYNVFVGYGADYNIPVNFRYSTAIGSNAIVTSANMVRFGDDNVTVIGGQVGWSSPSDLRVKKNIVSNVPGLRFIKLLEPVVYRFDIDSYRRIIGKSNSRSEKQGIDDSVSRKAKLNKEAILYTGFIAQDVEAAAKSIGYDFSGIIAPKNNTETYGLRYAEFIVPMVKAVQELDFSYDSIENEIERLNTYADLAPNVVKNKANKSKEKKGSSIARSEIHSNSTSNYSMQNFPNPFSDNTSITYSLPQNGGNNSIIVFSNDGKAIRHIKLAANSKQGSVNFDRRNIGQGTYSYSLISNGKVVATRKMIITNK